MKRYVVGALALVVSVLAATAGAAIQRTFVSSAGNDANPCTPAEPCRQFSAALATTLPGGEIVVVDSAGYGPVVVDKSVSIVAPHGVYAGITVFSGNGVVVNGAGVKVALRGLQINGQGGATGIFFQQGAQLAIDDCTISGMGDNGIDLRAAGSRTRVAGTIVRWSGNSGLYADGFSGTLSVEVSGSRFEGNQLGVFVRQGATAGVRDSVVTGNVNGVLFAADSPDDAYHTKGELNNVTITSNNTGLAVVSSIVTNSVSVMATRSVIDRNLLEDVKLHSADNNQTELKLFGVSSGAGLIRFTGAASLLMLSRSDFDGQVVCQSSAGDVVMFRNNAVRFAVPAPCSLISYPEL